MPPPCDERFPLRVIVCGTADGGTRALVGRLMRHGARSLVVADLSGQGEDADGFVAAAPCAELAVVVVDAGSGATARTHRDTCLLALFGVGHVVLAVDGLRDAGDAQAAFDRVAADYRAFAANAGLPDVVAVPVSGLHGDSVASISIHTPWYGGPTLLQHLDSLAATALQWHDEVTGKAADVDRAAAADLVQATIVWLHPAPLLPGRSYRLRHAGDTGSGTVSTSGLRLKHRLNVDTLEHAAAERLERGEIGVVEIELDRPMTFDGSCADRHTRGCFTLIDTDTQATVGAGRLGFALRRAANITWQALEVDKNARQRLAGHRSAVVWLTGLSGAGKSTIANLLEQQLHARGVRTYLLDGDNLRHGLNKDLGFTAEDRVENIRRVAEVARLMVDAGIVVIAAFISPFRAERRMARELMGTGEFIEVFVDTPLAVAEERDVKGLYGKARRGELKNFTGIDSPYEPPEHADVVLDTTVLSAAAAATVLADKLSGLGVLSPV